MIYIIYKILNYKICITKEHPMMDIATFSALGEPTRFRKVELLLKGPMTVGEIADRAGVSSASSFEASARSARGRYRRSGGRCQPPELPAPDGAVSGDGCLAGQIPQGLERTV
ncbi:hypothetical protein DFP94_108118 [Fontibacillus phaseoli]|uniref:HTH arsR-type domain-containing protein n=1 Tax=Fontibacillus phaseoli TaxID=1416533 RepID=A0A369BB83_9BACL|nr:hypothetical protein DFP94_108118 [Fontibacillus phaseoli]